MPRAASRAFMASLSVARAAVSRLAARKPKYSATAATVWGASTAAHMTPSGRPPRRAQAARASTLICGV